MEDSRERFRHTNMVVSMTVSARSIVHVCSFLVGITGAWNDEKMVVRFEDIPFQKETRVLNKTITCAGNRRGTFPSLTYTCDDIRVDGLRLAYGYYPGWGVEETCQETEGKQELASLCQRLLRGVNSPGKEVYGVFVNNATCRRTDQSRYMLMRRGKQRHKWVRLGPGYGWMSSISCMIRF